LLSGDCASPAGASRAAQVAAQLAKGWRLSNREGKVLQAAILYQAQVGQLARQADLGARSIHRFYKDAGEPGIDAAMVFLAHTLADRNQNPSPQVWAHLTESVGRLLHAWFRDQDKVIHPDPFLSGLEVMSILELSPGPLIGALLGRLREERAAGEILSRQQAVAYLKKWKALEYPHA
jgi:hypothetical protein